MSVTRCVLLGDVVASRDIDDRGGFRESLDAALSAVNDEFGGRLHTPVQVLKGVDEIGGVLEGPGGAYVLARRLHDELYPQGIRVAAVHGEIDVNYDEPDVAGMDGPAFHAADARLARLADEDLLFWLEAGDEPLSNLVSVAANATLTLRGEWTARQHEVARVYEREGTQTAAAEVLDVGQPAISKILQRIHWSRLDRIETTIVDVLETRTADAGGGST